MTLHLQARVNEHYRHISTVSRSPWLGSVYEQPVWGGATIPRMTTGCWDMAPSTLAQWVGGLGTFAAVIVALFKDPIRAWWNRPKLTAICTKDIPETVKVPIAVWQGRWPGGGGGRWDGACYFVR